MSMEPIRPPRRLGRGQEARPRNAVVVLLSAAIAFIFVGAAVGSPRLGIILGMMLLVATFAVSFAHYLRRDR